jgi:hypothetical protein
MVKVIMVLVFVSTRPSAVAQKQLSLLKNAWPETGSGPF